MDKSIFKNMNRNDLKAIEFPIKNFNPHMVAAESFCQNLDIAKKFKIRLFYDGKDSKLLTWNSFVILSYKHRYVFLVLRYKKDSDDFPYHIRFMSDHVKSKLKSFYEDVNLGNVINVKFDSIKDLNIIYHAILIGEITSYPLRFQINLNHFNSIQVNNWVRSRIE